MRQVQLQTQTAQQAPPNIKGAPPPRTATPQNVRANGSGQQQNNNGNRPVQPQTNVQPNVQNNSNRPPASNNAGQPQSNVQNNSNRLPASNNAGQQPQDTQPANSPPNNAR